MFSPDFFDSGTEIERIDFDGGAWVDVRKHLTVDERNDVLHDARRLKSRREIDPRTRQGNVVQTQEFDLVSMRMALLKKIIVRWSAPRPVDEGSIGSMPDRMAPLSAMSSRVSGVFTAIIPHPMSTPTAAGMIDPVVASTVPTVAPLP